MLGEVQAAKLPGGCTGVAASEIAGSVKHALLQQGHASARIVGYPVAVEPVCSMVLAEAERHGHHCIRQAIFTRLSSAFQPSRPTSGAGRPVNEQRARTMKHLGLLRTRNGMGGCAALRSSRKTYIRTCDATWGQTCAARSRSTGRRLYRSSRPGISVVSLSTDCGGISS